MDLKINGKNALVTGGANGIGEEISRDLAKAGVNIYFTTRSKKNIIKLKSQLKKYNVNVEGVVVDFLKKNYFEKIKKFLKKIKIDILVNNAGHNLNITDPYCGKKDWSNILELNFFNTVNLCNYVIPKMKKNGWGRIVNITSCAGLENMGPVTYGVAKAALTAYTRTMGRILATEAKKVVMSAVFPGVVNTKGGHWDKILKTDPGRAKKYLKERMPLGRFGKPSEISPIVVFHCSELASFSHGAIVPADAGQSRHFMYFNYLN
tara:strand:+ start:8094 stop:8882 length:789 start_codon:yes stop_codon:yes gene_type:complete